MDTIEKINKFLDEVKVFYLATVENDRPKCRPIGFHKLENGKLYFGVGAFKDVYHQMEADPYVEICATKGGSFIRYYGTAVFETDDRIANEVLQENKALQRIYDQSTDHRLEIFHLEDAIVEKHAMSKLLEKYAL